MIAGFLATRLGRWLAVAGAVLLAVLGIYRMGGRDARRDQREANLANHVETGQRVADAVADTRREADSLPDSELIERLRDRGAFRQ